MLSEEEPLSPADFRESGALDSVEQKCLLILSNKFKARQAWFGSKTTKKDEQQEQQRLRSEEHLPTTTTAKRKLPELKRDIYRIVRAALIAESAVGSVERSCGSGSESPRLLSLLVVTNAGCDLFLTSTDGLEADETDASQIANAQSDAVAKKLIAIRRNGCQLKVEAGAAAGVNVETEMIEKERKVARVSTLHADRKRVRIDVSTDRYPASGFSMDLYRCKNKQQQPVDENLPPADEKVLTVYYAATFVLKSHLLTEIFPSPNVLSPTSAVLVSVNSPRNGNNPIDKGGKDTVSGDDILLDLLQYPANRHNASRIVDGNSELRRSSSTAFVVCFTWKEELKELTLGKIMVHPKEQEAVSVYRQLLQEQKLLYDRRAAEYDAKYEATNLFVTVTANETKHKSVEAASNEQPAMTDDGNNNGHHILVSAEDQVKEQSPSPIRVPTLATEISVLLPPPLPLPRLLPEFPDLEKFFSDLLSSGDDGRLLAKECFVVILDTYYTLLKEDHTFWKTLAEFSRRRTCYLLLWQPPSDALASARNFRELRRSRLEVGGGHDGYTIPNFSDDLETRAIDGELLLRRVGNRYLRRPFWVKWNQLMERYRDMETSAAILLSAADSSETLNAALKANSRWPLIRVVHSDRLLLPSSNAMPYEMQTEANGRSKSRQHYIWNLTEYLHCGLQSSSPSSTKKMAIADEEERVCPEFRNYPRQLYYNNEIEFFRHLSIYGDEVDALNTAVDNDVALMIGAFDGGPEFRHFELIAERRPHGGRMSRVLFQDGSSQLFVANDDASSISSLFSAEIVPYSQPLSQNIVSASKVPPYPKMLPLLASPEKVAVISSSEEEDLHHPIPNNSIPTISNNSAMADQQDSSEIKKRAGVIEDVAMKENTAKRRLLNDGSTMAIASKPTISSTTLTAPRSPTKPSLVGTKKQPAAPYSAIIKETSEYKIHCLNPSRQRPFFDESFKQTAVDVIHLYRTVRGSDCAFADQFERKMWYGDKPIGEEPDVNLSQLFILEGQLRSGELQDGRDGNGNVRYLRLDMRYSWLFFLLCTPQRTSGAVRSLALKYDKIDHNMALSPAVARILVERAVTSDDEVAALFRKGLQRAVVTFGEDCFREACLKFVREKMLKELDVQEKNQPSPLMRQTTPSSRHVVATAAVTIAPSVTPTTPIINREGQDLDEFFDEQPSPVPFVATIRRAGSASGAHRSITPVVLPSDKEWKHNQPPVVYRKPNREPLGHRRIAVMLTDLMRPCQKTDMVHLFGQLSDEDSALLIVCTAPNGRVFHESFKPKRLFANNSANWLLVQVDNVWKHALLVESPRWTGNRRELGPTAFDNVPLFANLEYVCSIYGLKWFFLTL